MTAAPRKSRPFRRFLKSRLGPEATIKLKNVRDRAVIQTNAALNRQFVLSPRKRLYIETSGLCNLACKFCAYSKKEVAKVVMTNDMFEDIVRQATGLGYSRIGLTPLTGDVFMDKRIITKLRFLDSVDEIEGYHFFTNFAVPSQETIKELLQVQKLELLYVSLYGHDEQSFCAITQRPKSQYARLVRNLEVLFELASERNFRLEMGWRTTPEFRTGGSPTSELQRIVRKFESEHGIRTENIKAYDNWGGIITNDDVRDIGLTVNDGSHVYKRGVCGYLLYGLIVLADGRVNACAVRDANGTLIIGDTNISPLSDILSDRNPVYLKIIEEQMAGSFRPVCKSCDVYQSVYRNCQRLSKQDSLTVQQAMDIIRDSTRLER
jgi:hypothetical protein